MKKIISIPVIFLLFVSCTGGDTTPDKEQTQMNDLLKKGIKGNVKAIGEISFNSVEEAGEVQKGSKIDTTTCTFNDKGNLVEESTYRISETSLGSRVTYKYDGNGKLIEKVTYDYETGKLKSKNIYRYDDAGNQTEDNEYNADGSPNGRTTFKYNSKLYKTESNSYRPDGSRWDRNSYKYDANGNLVTDKSFDSGGDVDSRRTMKYDNKGNVTEEVNELPRITFEIKGKKMSGDNKLTYKYDDNGNVTEMIFVGAESIAAESNGEKHSFKYNYDKNLNWIKKIESVNNRPDKIRERVIEYF